MSFRVYDIKEKRYVTYDKSFVVTNDNLLLVYDGLCGGYCNTDSKRFIVEWSIGREDKNGKEIFDGDKVKWTHESDDGFEDVEEYIRIVMYKKEWCQHCADIFDFRTHIDNESLEIVGNVHDDN